MTDRIADPLAVLRDGRARTEKAGKNPIVPLMKICWAGATKNTTEDIAGLIQALDEANTGFLLWYYGWVFHSDEDRYDPAAVIK